MEFILLGLTDTLMLQAILFSLFLVIYTLTVVGNTGMILLIRTDSRLHTPMYFFLAILSFADVSYSSTITPKMLVDFLSGEENHLLCWLLSADVLLYSLCHSWMRPFRLMICDRYVAICSPLLYALIMSRQSAWKWQQGLLQQDCSTLWFTQGMWAACHSAVPRSSITSSVTIPRFLSSPVLTHACMKASFPRLLV